MVTKEQYDSAIKQQKEAQDIIIAYHAEQREAFKTRMQNNPIFTDEELRYSAITLCECGHGLAYPINCSGDHYWDCSAILKGIADKNVRHTEQLSFLFYSIKGESERNGTTRGVFRPKNDK